MSVFDLPPGYRMPAHEHRRSGVVLPIRGRYRARMRDRSLDAVDRRVVVLPEGAPHREDVGEEGARCLLVHSPGGEGVGDVALDDPRSAERPRAARLGRLLHRELGDATPLVVESLLLELFDVRPGSTTVASGSPGWMTRVLELVRDRYADRVTHDEIASEAGVSREHLARTFRRCHGLSLGAYVRKIRLLEAARLLREDDRPVAAIAARCGFADHSHLGRTFRRHFQRTPSEYRSRVGA
ncbi:MAG: AraC family transcriptional regulator [Gemmatimonadota bacterium]|nr:AraC family transcriptional regulator [Gemmatimonadota bacterium]